MSRDRPDNIVVVSLRRLVVSVDSRAHLATGCSVLEWSTLWSVAFYSAMNTALAESDWFHPWLFL